MICRSCSREIPDNSIFCNWCGEKQIRERRKKAQGIKVPKAQQLPSGAWFIRLRLGGQSYPITRATEKDARQEAERIKTAWRAGEMQRRSDKTLKQAIDAYIKKRENTLSPSTVDGYRRIQKNRFQTVMDTPISEDIDWQRICDAEAAKCSAKTLRNAWRFLVSVLAENGLQAPKVTLPPIQAKGRGWLEPEQIRQLLAAAAGTSAELPVCLALHSLRRSELMALQWDQIDLTAGTIEVRGAVVQDESHHFVRKEANKNASSARTVPIMIPALEAALKAVPEEKRTGAVVTCNPYTVGRRINAACRRAGLPEVGTHGLRHSFASLAYHLGMTELETMEIGGWSDSSTMRRIYTHLAAADRLKATNKVADFFKADGKNVNKNVNEAGK